MPRASELQQPTADDFELAKKYVLKYGGDALGGKLSLYNDAYLVDDPYTTSYCPYVCQPLPEGQLQFYLHAENWTPAYGFRPSKLLLIDAKTSTMFPIDYEALIRVVTVALSQGGVYVGLRVTQTGEWLLITVEPGWLTEGSLSPKSHVLGEGKDSFLSYRAIDRSSKEQFCHLHCHSSKSLLDGASLIENIPWQARLNGQPAIALTDHGNMFGAFKFNTACKENAVKPIFGVEGYLVDKVGQRYVDKHGASVNFTHHITLLAMNQEGWENLCELMTIAGRDHFYYHPLFDYELLARHSAGIIMLTGCFKGVVSWYLQEHDPVITAERPWARYDPNVSRGFLRWAKGVFGDRVYGEKMAIPSFVRYDQALPRMAQLFDEEGIPGVATVDCHYEVEEDAAIQAILSRVSKEKIDEHSDNRDLRGPFWIKPMDLIQHTCISEADKIRTCEIAERCNVEIGKKGEYLFPTYPHQQDRDWQAYIQSKGLK